MFQTRASIFSLAFILLLAPILNSSADTTIYLELEDDCFIPEIFGNLTAFSETTRGLCVSDDGTMFTVSHDPMWEMAKCCTTVSLIAWANNGTIIWSHRATSYDWMYFSVETDNTHVYAAGTCNEDVLVSKFDMQGNIVWNKTLDLGGVTIGRAFGITILDDGTIIVSGTSWEQDWICTEYFFAILNQTGDVIWSEDHFQVYPSPRCEANHFFISTGNTLEKRDSKGSVVWAIECEDVLARVKGDVIFTLHGPESEELIDSRYWWILPTEQAELKISTWSISTNSNMVTSSITFEDVEDVALTYREVKTALDSDGSLNMLVHVPTLDSWHLLRVDNSAGIESPVKLLDHQWSFAQLDIDVHGNIYIAATSEIHGLTVMMFDASLFVSSSPTTSSTSSITTSTSTDLGPLNITLLGPFIGIVIIDLILIVLLKQRWTKSS